MLKIQHSSLIDSSHDLLVANQPSQGQQINNNDDLSTIEAEFSPSASLPPVAAVGYTADAIDVPGM